MIVGHRKVLALGNAAARERLEQILTWFENEVVGHGAVIAMLADRVGETAPREGLVDAVQNVVQSHSLRYLHGYLERSFPDSDMARALRSFIENQSIAGFDKDTPEYAALQRYGLLRGRLERAILRHITLTHPEKLGLTEFERNEFRYLLDIADQVDVWFTAFLNKIHDEGHTTENPWAVMRVEVGEAKEITFPVAYPSVFRIGELYGQLARRLEGIQDDTHVDERTSKINFYNACADLFTCTDPSKTLDLLRAADEAFAGQKGKMISFHAMETAYAGSGKQRIPEFGIALLLEQDPADRRRVENVERLRGDMIQTLGAAFSKVPALVGRIRGTVERFADYKPGCYRVLRAGYGSTFRFAGKSVPNDGEAVLKAGRFILFDPQAVRNRFDKYMAMARQFFGDEVFERNFSDLTYEIFFEEYYAGHEIGHALGKVLGFHDRIPREEYGVIDEWKASAVMFTERHLRFQLHQELDTRPLRLRILVQILEYFRNAERRNTQGAHPYYLGDRMNIAILQDEGVLVLKGEDGRRWDFDWSVDRVSQFYTRVSGMLYVLMGIYDTGRAGDIPAFISNHDRESPFDREFVAWNY